MFARRASWKFLWTLSTSSSRSGSWTRRLFVAGYMLLIALSFCGFDPMGGIVGPLLLLAWLGLTWGRRPAVRLQSA